MRNRAVCLLLALLLLSSVFPLQAFAAEPTDFAETESPMISNSTDSSRLPTRESDISDVYGQVDAAAANEITSMFSDEAKARFASDLDRILDFEPIADEAASPVLTNVEHFLQSGGLTAYADADSISPWALDALRWANAEGLMLGRTETTLVPRGSATRAEAAAILMRFIENGKEG